MRRLMLVIGFAAMGYLSGSFGQGTMLIKGAAALVQQLGIRGGAGAAQEIATLGGQRGVQQILENAAKEGGNQLADKLTRYSLNYGPAILRGAKDTPQIFVSAFEKLPEQLRVGALQEIRRQPEEMQKLILQYGDTVLVAGARHPSVGPEVLSKIGGESAEFLVRQPTDQVIRVARLADDVAKAPAAERKALLSMIQQAPEKTLHLLEANPNILRTGAALTAFLLAKDQILGSSDIIIGPDGKPIVVRKPGVLETVTTQVTGILEKPLLIVAVVVGILLVLGSAIYLLQLGRPWRRRADTGKL